MNTTTYSLQILICVYTHPYMQKQTQPPYTGSLCRLSVSVGWIHILGPVSQKQIHLWVLVFVKRVKMNQKGNDLMLQVTVCLQSVCENRVCVWVCLFVGVSVPLVSSLSLLSKCWCCRRPLTLPIGRRCLSGEPQPQLQPACQYCAIATCTHATVSFHRLIFMHSLKSHIKKLEGKHQKMWF